MQINNTTAGKVTIIDIDPTSVQIAHFDGDNFKTGDQIILADWDGYGWKWVATKHIEGYQPSS